MTSTVRTERPARRIFFLSAVLLFAANAIVTVRWGTSMAGVEGMEMPGGWTMSMAWMLMPGETRVEAAASFLGMWTPMMVAMMLPWLAPMLWQYRESVPATGKWPPDVMAALAGSGYFTVWIAIGATILPLGWALADLEMRYAAISHAVPIATGAVVVLAGAMQFTARKTRCLACCRALPAPWQRRQSEAAAAWRYGVALGVRCVACCANLMAILLVLGVMDLRVMAIVMAAILVERFARVGERLARATGALALAAGVLLVVSAI